MPKKLVVSRPAVAYPESFDRIYQFFLFEFLVALMRDMHDKRRRGFSKKQVSEIDSYFGYIHSISVTFGDHWWFVFPFFGGTIEHKTRRVWRAFNRWSSIQGNNESSEKERDQYRETMGTKISALSLKYRRHTGLLKSDVESELVSKDIDFLYSLRSVGLSNVSRIAEKVIFE